MIIINDHNFLGASALYHVMLGATKVISDWETFLERTGE